MSYINKKFVLIFILIILIFISSQLNDYTKRKNAEDLSIQNNVINQNASNEKINLTINDNNIWRIFNSIFNINTDQFEYVNSKIPELISESKNFETDFNLFKKEFNQRFKYIYK